ncbi:MAG: orotidine-5'-phosphate decarboxylase [Synechococcales bacterium]|nr:orotidine-5'-phosphate decarboxylase [Cyanobacteria bacterium REEB444]MEB3125112.1 orotidine-5'-phosphate decarboxylase [Synechococcales bacterium]
MFSANQIIVALDVPDFQDGITIVDQLPEVSFWKVGLELFIRSGPAILSALKERDKQIFLDLKLHDIPNTMARACRVVTHFGVDLLTVHATAGKTALQASIHAVQSEAHTMGVQAPRLIAVTVLTSFSPSDLASDLKVSLPLSDYALALSSSAQSIGLDGVVCSPQEARQLRNQCGKDFLLLCPSIRPSWAKSEDQQRVMTPIQAVQAGADYLVIGRPIIAAPDPKAAFQRIRDEIDNEVGGNEWS